MRKLLVLVLVLVFVLAACGGVSQKDRELGEVHQRLAQQSLASGDTRAALAEIEKSVEKDPENPEARNLYGLLLHLYFQRLDAAVVQYRKAIELKPGYSEAKVNLGAALTAQGRCDEAIPLLDEARGDLLYREPYLAENNLGWCKYKKGDVEGALMHLRAAVSNNPGFCLGYRNLAEIAQSQGELDDAMRLLERYGKTCPKEPDADYRLGLVLLEQGKDEAARRSFLACVEKAKDEELGDECTRQAAMIPEG
ncbi:social motility TPR repeat lipoprotein Tgl [Vulgatibacter sp.]|uniref:social motility TPR repeat lipoprotein Tgl n=1 Tax=Vulgatibacter sp. TaxID=1971226 RepID=UPI00356811AD